MRRQKSFWLIAQNDVIYLWRVKVKNNKRKAYWVKKNCDDVLIRHWILFNRLYEVLDRLEIDVDLK